MNSYPPVRHPFSHGETQFGMITSWALSLYCRMLLSGVLAESCVCKLLFWGITWSFIRYLTNTVIAGRSKAGPLTADRFLPSPPMRV